MSSLVFSSSAISATTLSQVHHRRLKLLKSPKPLPRTTFPGRGIKLLTLCCSASSPWEPPPVTYARSNDTKTEFLKGASNIFDTVNAPETPESSLTTAKDVADVSSEPSQQIPSLTWPMWLLGPILLLVTGMVPTLWLPISSIVLGPNIASLLSLTGLDCIYNLGANLFLLLADSCARSGSNQVRGRNSKPPFIYQFWNMFANVVGLVVPLTILFGSQAGFLQPQLPLISFAVLLGPYLLLLSIQILVEMLMWHWQSPVWLVTPVVYEGYRLLQLMRGLKVGGELGGAPAWTMHAIRGLVCWWVLVLGVQLMRVAWFAGFAARAQEQTSHGLHGD